jgi:hypothetical protein
VKRVAKVVLETAWPKHRSQPVGAVDPANGRTTPAGARPPGAELPAMEIFLALDIHSFEKDPASFLTQGLASH